MEENKFKISFSTVLLIIAIIIIIIMGVVIILQNQQKSEYIAEKNNETMAYNTLSTKYNNLLNKVDDLQNQLNTTNNVDTTIPLNNNQISNNTVNSISINNNNTLNNTTSTQNNNTTTTTVLSNAEALKIGKEKYNQAMQSFWNDPDVDETQKIEINGLEYSKITDKSYISSMKALFSDSGYLNIFSNFKTIVETNSGDYYISLAARGSNIYYVGSELVVSNITDSKIEFISKDTYKSENNETITYNENNAFVLVKEKGAWKVDKFKLPN